MRHNFLQANTKYSDLLGTVAADRADPKSRKTFKEIFQNAGLDFSTYFPVAYSFSMPEEKWNQDWEDSHPMFVLLAHCVRRDEVGSTMQEVQEFIGPEGKLPVHRFSVDTELKEFFRLFKRLKNTFPNARGDTQAEISDSVTELVQDHHSLSRKSDKS